MILKHFPVNNTRILDEGIGDYLSQTVLVYDRPAPRGKQYTRLFILFRKERRLLDESMKRMTAVETNIISNIKH